MKLPWGSFVIYTSTAEREVPVYEIPAWRVRRAVETIPRVASGATQGLRGDRGFVPEAYPVDAWVNEPTLHQSYVLAYQIVKDAERAVMIRTHEASFLVDGLTRWVMEPDGLSVRVRLEFAPTQMSGLTGNTVPEIGELSGLALWLDASDTSKTNTINSKVYEWRDQGPNEYDALQTDDALRPLAFSRTINGLPAVEFSGAQWMRLLTTNNATTIGRDVGRLVFQIVAQSDVDEGIARYTLGVEVADSAAARAWGGVNGQANKMRLRGRPNDDLSGPGSTLLDGERDHDALPHLFTYDFHYATARSRVSMDGQFDSEAVGPHEPQKSSNTNPGRVIVGARSDYLTGWWDGLIGEIVVLHDPAGWEIAAAGVNLMDKWGISS